MLYKYNISGYKFTLSRAILDTYSESLFNIIALSTDQCDKDDDGYVFIQKCATNGRLVHGSIASSFNFNWLYKNLDDMYDGDIFIDDLTYYNLRPEYTCTGKIVGFVEHAYFKKKAVVLAQTVIIIPSSRGFGVTIVPNDGKYYLGDINGVPALFGPDGFRNSHNKFGINQIKEFWFSIKINGVPIYDLVEPLPNIREEICEISFTLEKISELWEK